MKKLILVIVAALLAIQSSSTTMHSVPVDQVGVDKPRISASMIPSIICRDGNNETVGTGVVVSNNILLTAEHVIDGGICAVRPIVMTSRSRSNPLTVTHSDPEQDFATVESRAQLGKNHFVVNCSGLIAGETYWLAGYAHGRPTLYETSGPASVNYFHGENRDGTMTRHLRGVLVQGFHGMSGGPVLNAKGEVVAIISGIDRLGSPLTMVKEIGDTKVCDGSDK